MIITNSIPNKPRVLQVWQKKPSDSYREPARLQADPDIPTDSRRLLPAGLRRFPMQGPPFFVHRMKKGDPNDPLLRQVLPVAGYLVPRLTRETSGRDSKIPLDLGLEQEL